MQGFRDILWRHWFYHEGCRATGLPTKDETTKVTENSKDMTIWSLNFEVGIQLSILMVYLMIKHLNKPVLANKELWMQENGLNKIRTIVYEVSSSAGNSVYSEINGSICRVANLNPVDNGSIFRVLNLNCWGNGSVCRVLKLNCEDNGSVCRVLNLNCGDNGSICRVLNLNCGDNGSICKVPELNSVPREI